MKKQTNITNDLNNTKLWKQAPLNTIPAPEYIVWNVITYALIRLSRHTVLTRLSWIFYRKCQDMDVSEYFLSGLSFLGHKTILTPYSTLKFTLYSHTPRDKSSDAMLMVKNKQQPPAQLVQDIIFASSTLIFLS